MGNDEFIVHFVVKNNSFFTCLNSLQNNNFTWTYEIDKIFTC